MTRPKKPQLYHQQFVVPAWAGQQVQRHQAMQAEQIYGSGHYQKRKELPEYVTRSWLRDAAIIEVQASGQQVDRYVVRGSYQEGIDLTIVMTMRTNEMVTGWLNDSSDIHRLTSERSRKYQGASL